MPDAPEWSIEFFIDDRGSSPVEEFLKELQPKERAAMLRTIRLLRSYGVQLPMPYARQVVGPIWELRAGAGRVFYFVPRSTMHPAARLPQEDAADSDTRDRHGSTPAGDLAKERVRCLTRYVASRMSKRTC
jgi:hypothetical protein